MTTTDTDNFRLTLRDRIGVAFARFRARRRMAPRDRRSEDALDRIFNATGHLTAASLTPATAHETPA